MQRLSARGGSPADLAEPHRQRYGALGQGGGRTQRSPRQNDVPRRPWSADRRGLRPLWARRARGGGLAADASGPAFLHARVPNQIAAGFAVPWHFSPTCRQGCRHLELRLAGLRRLARAASQTQERPQPAPGTGGSMIPNDFPTLNFDLGETADQLRASVRGFTSRRDRADRRPRSTRATQFPRELWPKLGELGAARHHGRGGVRRRGPRLPRALPSPWRRSAAVRPPSAFPTAPIPTFASTRSGAMAATRRSARYLPEADLGRARRRARHVGDRRGLRRACP